MPPARTDQVSVNPAELKKQLDAAKPPAPAPGSSVIDKLLKGTNEASLVDGSVIPAVAGGRKPYSVILLDEVEKAHPDVFNVLLQILDDRRLSDGQGRTVDFKNTVVVMTSNLDSQKIQQLTDEGVEQALIKIAVMAEVKANFRPEFVNRIDEIVVFHPLSEKQIGDIARIQLAGLESRLAKLEIRLDLKEAALKVVAAAGFDPVYGARPLKRAIQQQIENPLAKEILAGRYAAGDTVTVGATGGEITFARKAAKS